MKTRLGSSFALSCFGLLILAGQLSAGTMALRAVAVNDLPVTPTQSIDVVPGDTISAEVFMSGWGGGLNSYQLTLNMRESYNSGQAGTVLPRVYDTPLDVCPCESPAECIQTCTDEPDCTGIVGAFCTVICESNADCPAEFPRCDTFWHRCRGADWDANEDREDRFGPSDYTFVDPNDPDYCFGLEQTFPAASTEATMNFALGSVTISDTVPAPQGECYAGTFGFEVSNDACGTFTISAITTGETNIRTTEGAETPVYEPLIINVLSTCGACCEVNGCVVTPENECDGVYIGDETTCDPDPCECPELIRAETEPPNCVIDARYPHSPESGIPRIGITDMTLTFAEDTSEFVESDFDVKQVPGPGFPPAITSFATEGNQVHISIQRPGPDNVWLCVAYNKCLPNENRACWGRLPADVTNDRIANADDLTELIRNLNGGIEPPLALEQCDIDRSGGCFPPDLLGEINLLNGAGAFRSFMGEEIQVLCPSPTP